MKINWFPGHMAKSINDIENKARIADLFILVVDGRCPISSLNENFLQIAKQKMTLVIVTKIDLADKNKFTKIKKFFTDKKFFVLFVNLGDYSARLEIISHLNKIFKIKQEKNSTKFFSPSLKCFVVGVPNTGKSTLINLITKSQLKVGNQPGITRNNQWISYDKFLFLDTPGILLPKMDDQILAVKLAIIGLIRWEILNISDLFIEAYKIISEQYPNFITDLELKPSLIDSEIEENLLILCKNKKFINKSGLDLPRCRKWFLMHIGKQKITLD